MQLEASAIFVFNSYPLNILFLFYEMNSTKTLLFIGACVILAMTLLSDCVTSYVYDDDDGEDDGGDDVESSNGVLSVGKRSSTSALCRRCMFHRDDWMSCSLCYGRPRGIVPYYSKRSSVAADYEADDDDDETNEADDKRTRVDSYLLDHRCCDVLRIRQCCRRGAGKRDYYATRFPDDFDGGQEDYDDDVVRREYATRFFPLEGIGNGQCSCCDGPLLDYSCCSLSCSKRK